MGTRGYARRQVKSWPPCFRLSTVASKKDPIFQSTSMETFVSECGLGLMNGRELKGSNKKTLDFVGSRGCEGFLPCGLPGQVCSSTSGNSVEDCSLGGAFDSNFLSPSSFFASHTVRR
uniref:Uncharacterized protein n=1 Tax=Vitis vinifera TaxID=29760 RepID=F6I049_VITVI